jgi:hypothetical protein
LRQQYEIATIGSPEFINLQPTDINPFMSSCDIKVFYLGQNDNGTYIDKDTATKMSKTLRGAPIVGYYTEEKQDFNGHNNEIIFDGQEIRFKRVTRPYGFVSPDSKIWFQDFQERNRETGEIVTRTYLMTNGLLWTHLYEEANSIIEEGKGQSMELDSETLQGHRAKETNSNIELFIINDAIFNALCILGDDVTPCFEGASIYSLNNDFKKSLYTMMKDMQNYYTKKEGGQQAVKVNEELETVEAKTTTEVNETEDKVVETVETIEATESVDTEVAEPVEIEETEPAEVAEEAADAVEDSASLREALEKLQSSYNSLNEQFSVAQTELTQLREFKKAIDNEKKDELIAQFYMLDDADKADVIENKANYSLDEIEAKLSVICVRKKVNLSKDIQEEPKAPTTFSLSEETADTSADWLKEVLEKQRSFEEE